MSWQKEVVEIERKRALALELGGEDSVARQHAKNRQTVRERIAMLVDDGSFQEIGPGAGGAERSEGGSLKSFTPANFVLGFATIDQRRCVAGGEDFTVKGGSPNEAGLRKSVYAEQLALQYRVPLIRLHEGGGGSVGGTGSTSAGPPVFSGHRFRTVAETLSAVPVATAALGPVAGLPASRLVAAHLSVMSKETAQVLVAGPAVVKRAIGEDMTKEELGGAQIHTRNGVIDNAAEDEADALGQIRHFLSYLPQNVWELPPVAPCDDPRERREEALLDIIPRERRKLYNMWTLLGLVLDHNSFFEIGAGYGRGIITGLARMNGQPVGVLANNCRYLAGAMTADGSHKVRRFVELCETFHLPVLSFVDEPGFMIGSEAEKAATIRHGTSAVLSVAACNVPWASVVVRRSFGVAQAAHYGNGAYVLAWPSSESGPLPVEGGVAVAYGREIAVAPDPEARRRELEEQLAARQSPFPRAEAFSSHDIIDPRETRARLCDWIEWTQPTLEALRGPSRFLLRP